ncbi:PAS domain-containing sensor histidine kinase [Halalkalibacter urbisdiaboli]|uniref:PAS domain-containing sensor histidine kinase n=1 Tax=Halalkalibacter urbisdiaboli TaxID=1960589 RepID=UPI001A982C63|nr:PAS domain-containing sensor histidine kinase [Halalkalibacter urbisdiaboli]
MNRKKRILIIYLIVSTIWVIGSDYLLSLLHLDTYILLQRVKGVVFVLLTGVFIYYLLIKKEEFELLKQEKEKLSTLINSMVDFVNFKDGDGRWIEANNFGLKLFQLEGVDYRGKKDSELAEYTDFYREALIYCETSDEETWMNGKITYCEEVIPLPNGEEKTFDTIKTPLFYENGERKGLVVIGRDITEKKLAEQQLKESNIRYRSLFEYNPELVFMIDLKGNITDLNRKFEPLTGYSKVASIGKSILSFIFEGDRKRAICSFKKVLQEKNAQKIDHIHVIHAEGKRVIVNCAAVPIISDGEIIGIVGYANDVTQILDTEERLMKTEKLAVIGELAAGIAHEIRNPLTSLKGFVQMFQSESQDKNRFYRIMLDELERINAIVSELLVLARPQEVQFSTCDMNVIMNDVFTLLESEANLHGVTQSLEVAESSLLDCEPNQLKQLFINIMKNSTEAQATHIHVSISKSEEHIIVKIIDDGCGMTKERMEKLGEPFYSQKEKGTGLGLTVSFKIVQAHDGTIHYKSNPGYGTEVTIMLPKNNHSLRHKTEMGLG